MPFVDGQSLRERMETEGQFPVEEAVRIAREIADGLARAHAQGVIHRDVKPSNVLLSSGHAIVADFGIAAALDEAAVSRLTDTGVSLGSPAYMSPEQASGETDMDPRTDVYALGCVLYEMLGGKAAFAGSMRTLLTQKVLGKIEPLQELRPDVPPPIVDAVARAMATEPADRFPSAEAFSDALLAGIAKTGVGATARPWMIASAAAVVIVAAAALVMVQGIQGRSERALLVAQQLAEVEDLVEAGHYVEALILA
jgi:serine/threonine-protein kinase